MRIHVAKQVTAHPDPPLLIQDNPFYVSPTKDGNQVEKLDPLNFLVMGRDRPINSAA